MFDVRATIISAVWPSSLLLSGSAPAFSNCPMMSTLPVSAASVSGVAP